MCVSHLSQQRHTNVAVIVQFIALICQTSTDQASSSVLHFSTLNYPGPWSFSAVDWVGFIDLLALLHSLSTGSHTLMEINIKFSNSCKCVSKLSNIISWFPGNSLSPSFIIDTLEGFSCGQRSLHLTLGDLVYLSPKWLRTGSYGFRRKLQDCTQ